MTITEAENKVLVEMNAEQIMYLCTAVGFKFNKKKDGHFASGERTRCEQFLIQELIREDNMNDFILKWVKQNPDYEVSLILEPNCEIFVFRVQRGLAVAEEKVTNDLMEHLLLKEDTFVTARLNMLREKVDAE